jgi:RNA polymerase sigma-70 factor (ECF subfamily)
VTATNGMVIGLSEERGESASESAAFDERFAHARDRLLRICRSLVGADGAEDVVQDTYLLARARAAQLRDPSAFDAWVNRIAVNRCYGLRRRGLHLDRLLPGLVRQRPPEADLGLRELIERLPPRQRTILVLHYGHGYSLREIGELLDLTHDNVRAIVARTRRRLFSEWKAADR